MAENLNQIAQDDEIDTTYTQDEYQAILDYLRSREASLSKAQQQYKKIHEKVSRIINPDLSKTNTKKRSSSDTPVATEYKSTVAAEVVDCVASLNNYTADQSLQWASFGISSVKQQRSFDFSNWMKTVLLPSFYKFVAEPKGNMLRSCLKRNYDAVVYGVACRYASHKMMRDAKGKMAGRKLSFENPSMADIIYERNQERELVFVSRKMLLTDAEAAERYGRASVMKAGGYKEADYNDWYKRAYAQYVTYTHYVVERNELFHKGTGSRFIGVVTKNGTATIVTINDRLDLMPYIISEFMPGPSTTEGYSVLLPLVPAIIFNDRLMNVFQQIMLLSAWPVTLTTTSFELGKSDMQPSAIIQGALEPSGRRNIEQLVLPTNNNNLLQMLILKTNQVRERLGFGTLTHPEGMAGMSDTEVRKLALARMVRLRPIVTSWIQQDMIPACRHILMWLFDENGGGIEFPKAELGLDEDADPLELLDINYTGALIQEERELEKAQSAENTNFVMNVLAGEAANPRLGDVLNIRELIEGQFRASNIQSPILRSEADADRLAKRRNEAQQEAEALAQEQQGIALAAKLAAQRGIANNNSMGGTND